MSTGPTQETAAARVDASGGAPSARAEGLLDLIRFRQFRHFLVLPLAGVDLDHASFRGGFAIARGVAIGFLLLAFGYLANGVGDRHMDVDPEKNPLARAPARDDRRFDLPLATLAVGALGLAATGPVSVLIAAALCLLSGWAYSLGPRLKTKPVIGTVMNASHFAPLLFLGLEGAALPPRLTFIVPAFVALLLENQLLHEAADAVEDRRGAVHTTFLAVGHCGAALLAAASGAAVLWVTARVLGDRGALFPLAAHTIPHLALFPLLLARIGDDPALMSRARLWHRWCAAASGAVLIALTL